MTAERDGKSRRTDQPDLLASLPDERPPASQPAPGIDPAMIEELLTGVRDLREQFAGPREAESVNGGGNMYRGGGAKMYHGLGGSLSA